MIYSFIPSELIGLDVFNVNLSEGKEVDSISPLT